MPSDFKFQVVFLAPACNFELLGTTLQDYAHRLHTVRMFTMADGLEQKDHLVPVLYPRSLLYFISGVLEGSADIPIVGMQRFFSTHDYPSEEFPNVELVRRWFDGDPTSLVWSQMDGGAGRASNASSHYMFDDDPTTLDSVPEPRWHCW